MKHISLTQGQSATVDDEDFIELSKYKWYALWAAGTRSYYAVRNIRLTDGKQTLVLMHRVVLGLTDRRIYGDHVNHDTLNNRRENLRAVTHKQNLRNRHGANRGSTTGARGVYPYLSRYRAQIRVGGKAVRLGIFPTIIAASEAYATASRKYFGETGSI